jgi:hypothetical protein
LPRLCDLHFTGAENLARAADRVILGLVHVLNDVEVRTELAGEGLGRERRFRGARIASQKSAKATGSAA